jgi:DNA topoisomerase-3
LEKKEGKTQKKEAPLLYNLAEIQADCSKRLHIAPNQTLSILQSLYEQKLITYPRTDARVLTNAIVKKLSTNLNGLYKNPDYKELLLSISNNHWAIKGKYVDDSKVTDHYALIPTGQMPSGLDGYEAKLYDMVVRRFLSAFYPPAVYEKLSVVFRADKERFFASGTVLREPGFYEVVGIPTDEKGQAFFKSVSTMKQGESYPAEYGIHNGETQPPKPYTSGSMIIAMENAGKLIEDEELREQIKSCGIGTSATRAATIEKLVKNQYITLNQKTQRLAPTNLGQMIYEVVKANIPSMLSPKMTASWEKGLSQVEHGETSYQEYATLFKNYIKKHTLDMKGTNHTDELKPRIMAFSVSGFTGETFKSSEASFSCPLCGSPVKTTRKGGFICEKFDKDNGCHFYLGAPGAKLTEKQAEELIEGKTVGPFQMKAKKGNLFSASLKWGKEDGLQFVFSDREEGETEHLCPNCHKKLTREKWNYTCSCGFQIPRYMKPKWIDDEEVEYLLKNKKSHLFSGLISKDGKKYSCYLVIKDGKCEREFPPRRKKANGKIYSFAGDTPEALCGRLCHPQKRRKK